MRGAQSLRAEARWFVGFEGRAIGPYALRTLQALIERGRLQPDSLLWTAGLADWKRAAAIPGLVFGAAGAAPAIAAPVPARSSWFLRHWRGELSLRSAAGVCVLAGVTGALLIAGLYRASTARHWGTVGHGWWLLLPVLAVLAAPAWGLVGVWRSAERHPQGGGRRGWANLAQVLVFLGVLLVVSSGVNFVPTLPGIPLLGQDYIPGPRFRVLDPRTLELAGGMASGTADRLQSILDATPTIKVVLLNNIGGRVGEGVRVGALIKARGLNTYTTLECDSACTLAFIGGRNRYLGPRGRLGFHQASIGGLPAAAGTRIFREIFAHSGLPAPFIDRALSVPPWRVWYPSQQELVQAHVVTGIMDGK